MLRRRIFAMVPSLGSEPGWNAVFRSMLKVTTLEPRRGSTTSIPIVSFCQVEAVVLRLDRASNSLTMPWYALLALSLDGGRRVPSAIRDVIALLARDTRLFIVPTAQPQIDDASW